MTARRGAPRREQPSLLESSDWRATLLLVILLLILAAALGAGVAG